MRCSKCNGCVSSFNEYRPNWCHDDKCPQGRSRPGGYKKFCPFCGKEEANCCYKEYSFKITPDGVKTYQEWDEKTEIKPGDIK